MKLGFIFLLMTMGIRAFAQSIPNEDLSKDEFTKVLSEVNNWYLSTPNYSFEIKYISYNDYITKVPVEKQEGHFVKRGNNYLSSAIEGVTMQNDKYKVSLNNEEKIMAVSHPDSTLKTGIQINEYQGFLNLCSELKCKNLDYEKLYEMNFGKIASITKIQIGVNSLHQITRVIMFYRRKTNENKNGSVITPRLEIILTNYKTTNSTVSFDESQYFTMENKKIRPVGKYSNFKILNHIVKK